MNGTTVKYWEGRTPPKSYFEPMDPYKDAPHCPFNLRALSEYAKSVGKKIIELSYEEIEQFRTNG